MPGAVGTQQVDKADGGAGEFVLSPVDDADGPNQPAAVEVQGQRFQARNLVLATGARTIYPDVPGIRGHGVYDFATLIEELDYEPNRCVIIGGSKVALEYGSFFHATGCKTTILTRSLSPP